MRGLVLVVSIMGCAGEGAPSLDPAELEGAWSGTTSEGGVVELTVSDGAVTRFWFSYEGPGCSAETELTPDAPIQDGSFAIDLDVPQLDIHVVGDFTSATEAGGTVEANGCGGFSATWSASKTTARTPHLVVIPPHVKTLYYQ
jgi:hypothetical protein